MIDSVLTDDEDVFPFCVDSWAVGFDVFQDEISLIHLKMV